MSEIKLIRDFIYRWRISQVMLSVMCGMSKSTFTNCLNEKKYYYFTDQQLSKLKSVMINLHSDLENVISGKLKF